MANSKRIKICESYQYSLRVANKHARKELAKIDAENAKIDQIPLFKDLK